MNQWGLTIKSNYIYTGDCKELLLSLPDNSVDLIIADPPYFEINGEFDFVLNNVEEYITWCTQWIQLCKKVLKPTGSFYIWGAIGYQKGYALPKIADWIERENLFVIQNWITQKNTRGYGQARYIQAREELLFLTVTQEYTWNRAELNIARNRSDLGANGNTNKPCSDVWIDICDDPWDDAVWDDITEASQSSKQRFKDSSGKRFPTVKALALCDRIIQASSNPGDLILILFAGSGSKIIISINNNRKFIAAEINPIYVKDIILPRIKKNSLDVHKMNNIYYTSN